MIVRGIERFFRLVAQKDTGLLSLFPLVREELSRKEEGFRKRSMSLNASEKFRGARSCRTQLYLLNKG